MSVFERLANKLFLAARSGRKIMLGVKNKNIYSTSGEAIRFIDSQLHRVELNRMDMQMIPKVLNGLQFHIAFAYG